MVILVGVLFVFVVSVCLFVFSQESEMQNFAASSSLPWKSLHIKTLVTAAAHSVLEIYH